MDTNNYLCTYTIAYLQLYEYLYILMNIFLCVRTIIFVYIQGIGTNI